MRPSWRGLNLAFVAVLACVQIINVFYSQISHASPLLIQKNSVVATANTNSTVTLTTATAGNLLIVVCGVNNSVTITGPTGFTAAINETGTVSQAIFYKIAAGNETSFVCTSSSSSVVVAQAFEYSGVNTTTPLDAKNTISSTGNSGSYLSGDVTTTTAGDILLASFMLDAGSNIGTWTNLFTPELSGSNSTGKATTRYAYGSADNTAGAAGIYSTGANGSTANWRGQIVAFRPQTTPVLSVDVVDNTGVPVTSPSVNFGAATTSFGCQPITSSLGTSSQKIRITNTTTNPAWTVSIAATSGNTSTWTSGSNTYSYNDATSSGCATGQLYVAAAAASITSAGCSNTGITSGANTYFTKGVYDSITLASATASASTNCSWDITSISMTQQIPAEQKPGTYSLGLTITVVAN